jgi:hypothetical protein
MQADIDVVRTKQTAALDKITDTLDFLKRNLDLMHKTLKVQDDQISTNDDMLRRDLDGVKAKAHGELVALLISQHQSRVFYGLTAFSYIFTS